MVLCANSRQLFHTPFSLFVHSTAAVFCGDGVNSSVDAHSTRVTSARSHTTTTPDSPSVALSHHSPPFTLCPEPRNNALSFSVLYHFQNRQESDSSTRIAKDLKRTFASHPKYFQTEGSTDELKRILTAYSNFDTGLGYCQGMNYIAAYLIHR